MNIKCNNLLTTAEEAFTTRPKESDLCFFYLLLSCGEYISHHILMIQDERGTVRRT